MTIKSPLKLQNGLARLLGASIKGVEKEFSYMFKARKNAACPAATPKPAAIIKEAAVTPAPVVATKPVMVEKPVIIKVVVAPEPSARVEPVAPAPEKIVVAPVVEKKPVSVDRGMQGFEFKNKAEQLEVEIYTRDLRSSSRPTRAQALGEIKKLSRPLATAILMDQLSFEQDTLHIAEIINALATICDVASTPKDIFKKYAAHPDAGIRLSALRAISKYHDEETFDILTGCMKDKDAEVRRQMLNCLCWTFGERCLIYAVNALHDHHAGVRKVACQITGALKAKAAVSGLISLLSDADKEVQSAASAALKKISGEDFGFKVTGTDKEKGTAIEDWRFWWRDNQAKFTRVKA
ncbi:MAG: hypothetical protein HQL17_02970 [Candidatus Omnitrophica bacterium]|nr:hypothetical protein [Candidatus Omnitrophota bacterium]